MSNFSIEEEIKNILSRLEENERRILEDKVILKYLQSKLQGSIPPLNAGLRINNNSTDLNIEELIKDTEAKESRSMVSDVKEAIAYFGEREFSVPMVAALMFRLGIINNVDEKLTKSKISAALAQLTIKEGFLIRTVKGGGNVPHKYKIVRNEEIKHSEDLIDESINQESKEPSSSDENSRDYEINDLINDN